MLRKFYKILKFSKYKYTIRRKTHPTNGRVRFFATMDGGEHLFNHQMMFENVTK